MEWIPDHSEVDHPEKEKESLLSAGEGGNGLCGIEWKIRLDYGFNLYWSSDLSLREFPRRARRSSVLIGLHSSV